jgi:type IV secretory pathway VirB2 component (pilin)
MMVARTFNKQRMRVGWARMLGPRLVALAVSPISAHEECLASFYCADYTSPRLLEISFKHPKGAIRMTSRKAFLSPHRRSQAARISYVIAALCVLPLAANAQSPFDTGFTAIQTLFTGTVAKAASLIAIVLGGYAFAHGEPGAKKALAGVAAGTGIAVLAVNVLTWMWGI